MKRLLMLIALALPMFAQTTVLPSTAVPLPSNFFGITGGLTQNLPQQRATGGIVYGHNMGSTIWAFTRVEVLGVSQNPAQAQTLFTQGACDIPHALFNGRLLLGWCLDGGVASSGQNLASAISTEGLALWRFGKKQNFGFGLMGGFTKTGVTPANAIGENSALTPIRATLVYGF